MSREPGSGPSTAGPGGAPGILFVVSNTLGNPEDLSPRARRTLAEADLIFAEDTRTAHRLLESLGVDRPLRSCFDANEPERAAEAAALLAQGKTLALLSEAGTPALSDPGYRVVRAAVEVGARVVPVPGPSAVLAALVASGLPPDRFVFLGFPPRKPGPRRKLLASLELLPATLVLYESPHRVGETLADLAAVFGPDRQVCLARELTKTHEELIRGSLADLAGRYRDSRPLGEITLVVEGARVSEAEGDLDGDLLLRSKRLLQAGYTPRDVAEILAAETGKPRKDVYALVQSARDPEA